MWQSLLHRVDFFLLSNNHAHLSTRKVSSCAIAYRFRRDEDDNEVLKVGGCGMMMGNGSDGAR